MEKSRRVKTKQDFQSVISSKQRFSSTSFVVYYKNNNDNTESRFGISASKKLGDAVVRVKTRRQVRAMVRTITKDINLQPKDYVIIVRVPYLKKSFIENLEDLKVLLIKIGGNKNE